jgi:hypothetical protein
MSRTLVTIEAGQNAHVLKPLRQYCDRTHKKTSFMSVEDYTNILLRDDSVCKSRYGPIAAQKRHEIGH